MGRSRTIRVALAAAAFAAAVAAPGAQATNVLGSGVYTGATVNWQVGGAGNGWFTIDQLGGSQGTLALPGSWFRGIVYARCGSGTEYVDVKQTNVFHPIGADHDVNYIGGTITGEAYSTSCGSLRPFQIEYTLRNDSTLRTAYRVPDLSGYGYVERYRQSNFQRQSMMDFCWDEWPFGESTFFSPANDRYSRFHQMVLVDATP